MSRFNSYLGSHFSACRLLAESYDLYRKRPVRLYLIPGEFEFIGVTDGTDAWIAPVTPQCFRINVADLVKRIRAGEDVAVSRTTVGRPRVTLIEEPAPRRRSALIEEPQPRRRRIILEN